jgi:prepilin-type N-terminal cleavage/methylation domain-containing protein
MNILLSERRRTWRAFPLKNRVQRHAGAGFTMVEIAICLAIIGIALVGIIGVLPYGMNTQRDTREETVMDQDVGMLLPAITQGMRGMDDLTNYVYAITNYWTLYNYDGTFVKSNSNGYTVGSASVPVPSEVFPNVWLTNGLNIVGLLSTPEYIADAGNDPAVPGVYNDNEDEVYSNHIVAYVRALSGLASEKPPQDNTLMVNDAFTYRLLVVNAPAAMDTNIFSGQPYYQHLWQNERELRLTFLSPQQPNGSIGNNRLTYRATVAGQLVPTNNNYGTLFYFYQPQSFTGNTNFF